MTRIGRFIFSIVTLLAAYASPAFAGPTKIYSLLVQASPTYVNTTTDETSLVTPVLATAYIKNEAPPPGDANSNITSFTLAAVGSTIVGPITCPRGNCTLDSTTNTITVTNISPPIQAHEVFPLNFGTASCGDATWTATVWSGSQTSGNAFALVQDPNFFDALAPAVATPSTQLTNVSCGLVACSAAPFTVSVSPTPAITDPRYVTGLRGVWNKDGSSACGSTNYYVTNQLLASDLNQRRMHFRWPVSTGDDLPQPYAVFSYTVNLVGPNTGPKPQVAWLNADGSPATNGDGITDNPYFIPAPACLSSLLPAPYGSLAVPGVSADATQIQVNGAKVGSLPKRPFPAVIGTERIQVTDVSGTGTWTVQRGQGGTARAPHDAGSNVMSTPLPILSAAIGPYHTSDDPPQPVQAHVCVVGAPVKNSAGNWTTKFIDIGDAYVKGTF